MRTFPTWTLLLASAFSLSLIAGCDVIPPDPQVEQWGDQSTIGNDGGYGDPSDSGGNPSYDYTFTCPSGGGENSVPIPPGSASCQRAFEFYAEAYGCNLVGDFTEANCRVCDACGNANGACHVCEGG